MQFFCCQLDYIQLKQNRWVPRREDNAPKTIEEIHKEAQEESVQKQIMLQRVTVDQKRGGRGSVPPSKKSIRPNTDSTFLLQYFIIVLTIFPGLSLLALLQIVLIFNQKLTDELIFLSFHIIYPLIFYPPPDKVGMRGIGVASDDRLSVPRPHFVF